MLLSFDCCIERARGRDLHEAEPTMTCFVFLDLAITAKTWMMKLWVLSEVACCSWSEPTKKPCHPEDRFVGHSLTFPLVTLCGTAACKNSERDELSGGKPGT